MSDLLNRLVSWFLTWFPFVLWGALFVLVLYVFIVGAGADSAGQVCSETGVADSTDYNC